MFKSLATLTVLIAFGNATAQPTAGNSALDWAKKKCIDIGFKAGTERFGNCVLQLSRNDETVSAKPKTVPIGAQQTVPAGPKLFKDCDECPEMVAIPSGKFLMGSKVDPFAASPPSTDEQPQHSVSIKSFSMGKYEVTQEQWYLIMGTMPSRFKGRTLPVEQVSWGDAQEFLKKLSEKTGKRYRLPSEAEWEYAARGGTQTEFPFGENEIGLDQYSWYVANASNTKPVGQKSPNQFGLFDMHGNVWEWVEDCWSPTYLGAPTDGQAWIIKDCVFRTLRGGSWINSAYSLRSAYRFGTFNSQKEDRYGFRVARDN